MASLWRLQNSVPIKIIDHRLGSRYRGGGGGAGRGCATFKGYVTHTAKQRHKFEANISGPQTKLLSRFSRKFHVFQVAFFFFLPKPSGYLIMKGQSVALVLSLVLCTVVGRRLGRPSQRGALKGLPEVARTTGGSLGSAGKRRAPFSQSFAKLPSRHKSAARHLDGGQQSHQRLTSISSLDKSKDKTMSKKRAFARLLTQHKSASRHLDADQQAQVRRVISEAASINTSFWAPPLPATGEESDVFMGRTFTVVLYHLPPFVIIRDWRAVGLDNDPGNARQTRTRENGDLSGLTIDLLSEVGQATGCNFKFVYPCSRQAYFQNNQRCPLPTADEAFTMLTQANICDEDACPPGFWRAACRNGHSGACLACETCGPGLFRKGCGETSPGEHD